MQHKLDLEYKGGLKDVAEDVADLRYDKTEEFLTLFSEKIKKDAEADFGRGRVRLSESLHATSKALLEAKEHMAKAWRISEPYMKDDGSC